MKTKFSRENLVARLIRELADAQQQINMDTVRLREMQEAGVKLEIELKQLREAVARLPDVTLDDVPRDSVPTHELIRRIRDCRALLIQGKL